MKGVLIGSTLYMSVHTVMHSLMMILITALIVEEKYLNKSNDHPISTKRKDGHFLYNVMA